MYIFIITRVKCDTFCLLVKKNLKYENCRESEAPCGKTLHPYLDWFTINELIDPST